MRIKLLLIFLVCSLSLAAFVTVLQRDRVDLAWTVQYGHFIFLREATDLEAIHPTDPAEFILYPGPMTRCPSFPATGRTEKSPDLAASDLNFLPRTDYSLRDFERGFYRYLLRSLLDEHGTGPERDRSSSH